MLKITGVKLELLTDENMLLLFEKGIPGGMCKVIHKYAKANNKHMKNYKRIQVDDKITTYPYGYINNDTNINFEIKSNTDKLNEIDNSGIITKNYNTKKENSANVTLDINDITNVDYLDSVKSVCVDKIKSTNAINNYLDSAKSACLDKTKSNNVNNAYLANTKSTYVHRYNVKSVHSNNNIIYELNKLITIKRVTDTPIIINKKSNFQAITIAYELNKLRQLKKSVIHHKMLSIFQINILHRS